MLNFKSVKSGLFLVAFITPQVLFAQNIALGVNSHIINQNIDQTKKSVILTKDLKMQYIRMDLPWRLVESTKGNYQIPKDVDAKINLLLRSNIQPIIILDYGNKYYNNGDKPITDESIDAFVKYATYVVNYYKNRIFYYQIWNEWDSNLGNTKPGKVEDYKKLVKATYTAIKKEKPEIKVITSSFSAAAFNKTLGIDSRNFINTYLTDDMSHFTDIIAIHPYTAYRKGYFSNYQIYKKQIQYTMNFIRKGSFKDKPVFITEIGWSTSNSPQGISEETQKQFINNAICDAKKAGISAIIIYELNDASSNIYDTESGFGLVKYNGLKKPAYVGIKSNNCL